MLTVACIYPLGFQQPPVVYLEASGTELLGMEALQELVGYVLPKVYLPFGNSLAAPRA